MGTTVVKIHPCGFTIHLGIVKTLNEGWAHGSVRQVLAVQTGGPESDLSDPH